MRLPRTSAATLGVAGISLLYWICAGMRAAYRPFWFDELITWHVSRLPTVPAIWAALHAGVDQEAPFTHLAVRLCQTLFGAGHLATRLPALVGFWIMLLGLYVFLKRRLPLPFALIGMVFPMLTFAWSYAFEARAYGVILGCGAAALVAWQNVADGRWRRRSLAALAASLALGLGSHPFFALTAIPLSLGEGMRTLDRKRIDWGVWLAFAAGSLGLLTYLGSLHATSDWDLTGLRPTLSGLPGFYDLVFRTAIAPTLFASLAVCVFARREKHPPLVAPIMPRHETAALFGFIVAPIVFMLATVAYSRLIFIPRYGLPCVIGAAGGLAVVMFRATGGSRRSGAVILTVLVAWLALSRGREAFSMAGDPRLQFVGANPMLMDALATGAPVVTASPLIFLAADFYLPGDVLTRLYYLTADRQTARQYSEQDSSDQLLQREVRVLPVRARLETLQSFTGRNSRFLLYSTGSYPCVPDTLARAGWRMTMLAHRNDLWLYEFSAAAPPR